MLERVRFARKWPTTFSGSRVVVGQERTPLPLSLISACNVVPSVSGRWAPGVAPRSLPVLPARTLHPSLKARGGPVPLRPTCEKKLNHVGLSPSYAAGRHVFFQMTNELVVVVRVFLVAIGHLQSLSGLLKNDNELDVYISNRLEFPTNNPKTAVGRKKRFFLMKIRR
jgi:hypothetical protein